MSERVEEVFFVGSKSLYGDLMSHEAYLSLRDEEYENLDKIRPVNLDHIGARSNPEGEGALQWGVPVKTEFMPKVAITKGRKRALADFDKCYGMAMVSEKFRRVVESLEPGIHQFVPVDMRWGTGEKVEGQFYWFVVCNSIDSVNAENTDAPFASGISNYTGKYARSYWRVDKEGGGVHRIVFDLNSIQGCHIWRDKYLVEGPYCSGIFKRACEQAGISGIGFGVGVNEVV